MDDVKQVLDYMPKHKYRQIKDNIVNKNYEAYKLPNIDINKVKNAKPKLNEDVRKIYAFYQKERAKILKLKDFDKLPPPYTDDDILSNFSFTNVKRFLDRESRNFINNVLSLDIPLEHKQRNIILFRITNKWKSWADLGYPNLLNWDKFDEQFNDIREKLKVQKFTYNSAYMVSKPLQKANAVVNKHEETLLNVLEWIKNVDITIFFDVNKIMNALNDTKIPFGIFYLYQFFVDYSYIRETEYTEDDFILAGPGCIRGLKYLFEDFDGMNYEEALIWVVFNFQDIVGDYSFLSFLPEEFQVYTLMDVENSFCELSKYVKIKDSQKNGKRVKARKKLLKTPNECFINNF